MSILNQPGNIPFLLSKIYHVSDHSALVKKPSGGLPLMALSALSFSVMALLVKLGDKTMPEQELIVFRSLFIICVTLPIMWRKKVPVFGNRRGLLLLRGVLGYVAMSCYFWTLGALPVADAMVIQYASPIFTIVMAAIFLKERASAKLWIAVVLCMSGVFAIAKPEGTGDPLVAVIGLVGAILAGGAYATVRELRKSDSAYTIVFYFPLVSLPFSVLLALPEWRWPTDWQGWGIIGGVCLASYLGQIFLTKALERETAGRAVIVNYISVAFGVLFGLVFFETIPDFRSVVGIAMILLAIGMLTRR